MRVRWTIPGSSAVVVKETFDLLRNSRHNGAVEQRVQTGKQKSADDDGDENLHAGIDVAFYIV